MKPGKFFHNFFGHLHTINTHKLEVMKNCFRVGLYKQGLLHDLSKYSFSEFIPGVKYYQDGNRSPNNAQREAEGCSTAWLHHKGRNKHHYEYLSLIHIWKAWVAEENVITKAKAMGICFGD